MMSINPCVTSDLSYVFTGYRDQGLKKSNHKLLFLVPLTLTIKASKPIKLVYGSGDFKLFLIPAFP